MTRRLAALERLFGPVVVRNSICGDCGLERDHVWTLAEARSLLRLGGTTWPATWGPKPTVAPQCLCECRPGDHCLAELTRGSR
jgi:hypothetical protein